MENESNYLFLDLIEIGLVRKKIFQKLSSFSDISNLGKTCSQIDFIINNDKIKKTFMCYEDKQIVEIKIKDHNDSSVYELDDVEFEKYNNSSGKLDELKVFFGERICLKSCINFYIDDVVDDFEKRERLLFVEKLVEELNFNHQIRNETKILNFMIDSFDNHDIILHTLSHICHKNIKRIEVPDSIFTASNDKYDGLNFNIFENLSQFNEFVIYATPSIEIYKRLLDNKNIIDKILENLSKKENSTIILENLYHYHNKIIPYVLFFNEISKKYNIKIKCNVNFNCNGLFLRRCKNCLYETCTFFPIRELVTSIKFENGTSHNLFSIMQNWQNFTNLETLELAISDINIKECIQNNGSSVQFLSLKNCSTLKRVKFDLRSSFKENDVLKIQEVHSNLIILMVMMPSTIEVLELLNIPDLNNILSLILNIHMENLKVLIMNRVSFKDLTFLNNLKNLECYISNDNWIIEVPSTIKLLGIGHKNNKSKDDQLSINNKIINTYSNNFSKCLKSMNDQFIFFNESKYWDIYKKLLYNI
ncbi:Hypothetical protein SRAE_1000094900 [Strongyloides ratti]|uniref:F-box domain-containing protein n=1 Tax=Strongyloides ratti TaxID=34506 RepID=A0A090L5E7_STRRB|nr:Hypothetical protein SRAE_1000094900 [Strongyloides ratti]CEF62679.1 Hypothetical protein SRAE_1000094900 [Strongyloides ratti]